MDTLPLGLALWKNLRELRKESLKRGLLEAAGVTIFLSLLSALLLFGLSADEPSAELLETLGQIGATLLIAYVLEVSWLVKASKKRPLEERENRLGAFLGIGAAGLTSLRSLSYLPVARITETGSGGTSSVSASLSALC